MCLKSILAVHESLASIHCRIYGILSRSQRQWMVVFLAGAWCAWACVKAAVESLSLRSWWLGGSKQASAVNYRVLPCDVLGNTVHTHRAHSGSVGTEREQVAQLSDPGGESLEEARRHQNDPGLKSPSCLLTRFSRGWKICGNGRRAAKSRIMRRNANAQSAGCPTVTMAAADQDPDAPA
jgi:hypothetical protein